MKEALPKLNEEHDPSKLNKADRRMLDDIIDQAINRFQELVKDKPSKEAIREAAVEIANTVDDDTFSAEGWEKIIAAMGKDPESNRENYQGIMMDALSKHVLARLPRSQSETLIETNLSPMDTVIETREEPAGSYKQLRTIEITKSNVNELVPQFQQWFNEEIEPYVSKLVREYEKLPVDLQADLFKAAKTIAENADVPEDVADYFRQFKKLEGFTGKLTMEDASQYSGEDLEGSLMDRIIRTDTFKEARKKMQAAEASEPQSQKTPPTSFWDRFKGFLGR